MIDWCHACGETFKPYDFIIDMYPPMHQVCPWAASLAAATSHLRWGHGD